MKSAALEAVLSDFSTLVVPASHLERPSVPTVPCGVSSVDELTGGLPRGCLTEICGPASSGRTTLLLSALAEATGRGEVCALVDANDSFDPLSAQQADIDLERLLWVRCGHSTLGTEHSAQQHPSQRHRVTEWGEGKSAIARRREQETRFIHSGMKNCGSRGVHTQLYSGMPELPEINVLTRPEQRYRDINKLKQGDYSEPGKPIPPQRHKEPAFGIRHSEQSAFSTQQSANANHGSARINTDHNQRADCRESMWFGAQKSKIEFDAGAWKVEFSRRISAASRAELSRVEQALKVTDLLLQSGGFGLIALDLGDISTRNAGRVPLTSWFRFRRAVENTATVLLVLEREAHARSCASLVLQLSAVGSRLSAKSIPKDQQPEQLLSMADVRVAAETPSHAELLNGIASQAEVARGERKPVASVRADFTSRSAWSA